MYPNPSNGQQVFLSITDIDPELEYIQVEVFNAKGQKVSDQQVVTNRGSVLAVLNGTDDLSNGLYMVRAIIGNEIASQQLMIQK